MELVQNKEGLVATLTVKVSQEDYAAKVEKNLKKMRQTSQVKGFRPGNAPMSLIKKMYGQSVMFDEINKIVCESIENYEKENSEYLLGHVIPSSDKHFINDFNEQRDFEFVYEACFFPEFTYKIDENTELPYYNIIVNEQDIDEEINYFSERYPNFGTADVIDDNCNVKVNINLAKDGEEKTHSTNILMDTVLDEYKSLFLGASVNDVINVEIRKVFISELNLLDMLELDDEEFELLPETLPFTIVEISKKMPPAFEQEFFDRIAGKDIIHSEEELREHIRQNIVSDYELISLDNLYLDSVSILEEKINVVLPEDFIEKYIRFLQNDDEKLQEGQFERMVQHYTNEMKWAFILSSILKQSGFIMTLEMIKEETKKDIRHNMHNLQFADLDNLVNIYLQNEDYVQDIIEKIKRRKLSVILKENAKLNVVDITFAKFRELYQQHEDNKKINAAPDDGLKTDAAVNSESTVEDSETVNTEIQENNTEKQE
ncbi:MAG: hypothetical protein LBH60_04320 [Prevotellaceae bacterium]|jgi:trigger factor|nr:hypothetical protein [Prevotellaceae bacterium]